MKPKSSIALTVIITTLWTVSCSNQDSSDKRTVRPGQTTNPAELSDKTSTATSLPFLSNPEAVRGPGDTIRFGSLELRSLPSEWLQDKPRVTVDSDIDCGSLRVSDAKDSLAPEFFVKSSGSLDCSFTATVNFDTKDSIETTIAVNLPKLTDTLIYEDQSLESITLEHSNESLITVSQYAERPWDKEDFVRLGAVFFKKSDFEDGDHVSVALLAISGCGDLTAELQLDNRVSRAFGIFGRFTGEATACNLRVASVDSGDTIAVRDVVFRRLGSD